MAWKRKKDEKDRLYYEDDDGWIIEGYGKTWRAWKSLEDYQTDYRTNFKKTMSRDWSELAAVNWTYGLKMAKDRVQALKDEEATKYKTNPEEDVLDSGDVQIKLSYKDDRSDKQYYINVMSNKVEIQYGKTGSNLKTLVREFDNQKDALKFAKSKEKEKRNGGYTDLQSPFISKRKIGKKKQVEAKSLKPKIMKANRYNGKKDYSGWLVSEKFDGFRAVWDGEKFISKNGNVFFAPDSFTAGFPKIQLDGELWLGRGKYQEGASIIKTTPGSEKYDPDAWNDMKYVVFDFPGLYKSSENKDRIPDYMRAETFEDAIDTFEEWLDNSIGRGYGGIDVVRRKLTEEEKNALKSKSFVDLTFQLNEDQMQGYDTPPKPNETKIILAPQKLLTDGSKEEIDKILEQLVSEGAEGIMIRDPSAPYSPKRTSSIIKYKPSWTDEAKVIGYEEGLGKNEGQIGSLIVEKLNQPGKTFKLSGMKDAERVPGAIPIGSIVEYKHLGLMKSGSPRHASYLRIRQDMNRRFSQAVRNINGKRFVGTNLSSKDKMYARRAAEAVRRATDRNVRVIPNKDGFRLYVGDRKFNKSRFHPCVVEASKKTGFSKEIHQASFDRGWGAANTNPQSVRNRYTGKKRPGGWPKEVRMSNTQWACARTKQLKKGGNFDQDLLR